MLVKGATDVTWVGPWNSLQVFALIAPSATVYPKKYAHGFCFAVLCCSYTLTDFPISISLTSLALWQSNDCPSASKATLMNMDKYFMWIHYERLHNHNKAKHNKTVCIFLGIYCMLFDTCSAHGVVPWLFITIVAMIGFICRNSLTKGIIVDTFFKFIFHFIPVLAAIHPKTLLLFYIMYIYIYIYIYMWMRGQGMISFLYSLPSPRLQYWCWCVDQHDGRPG